MKRPWILPSSCGQRPGAGRWVETVVLGFRFGGRDVADAAVKPVVVPPVDPGHGGQLDVEQVAQWPVQERARAQALGLVEPDDAFHEGVVVGVADAADGVGDALLREVLGVEQRGVLRPRVVVLRELSGLDGVPVVFALPGRHPQTRQNQLGRAGRRGGPADDPLGVDIDDERHEHEAGPGPDVGEVSRATWPVGRSRSRNLDRPRRTRTR